MYYYYYIESRCEIASQWNPTETSSAPTLHPLEETTRRSAGMRSPPLISTRSPRTTNSALICIFSPSRITNACWHGEKREERGEGGCEQREDLVRGKEEPEGAEVYEKGRDSGSGKAGGKRQVVGKQTREWSEKA